VEALAEVGVGVASGNAESGLTLDEGTPRTGQASVQA
jgi:hypothetical protein